MDTETPFVPSFNPATNIIDNSVMVFGLKPMLKGDNMISWSQSLFSSSVLNAIAQQCSREAANELVNLRTGLCTEEEIVEDKCPQISSYFDEFTLKEEFAATRTAAQVANLEMRYAWLQGIIDVAIDLEKAWKTFFVNSPARRDSGPQYGLKPNPLYIQGSRTEPRFSGILSFEDALKYYYGDNSRVRSLKARFETKKEQMGRMDTLAGMSTEERKKSLSF
jgi:hypothetical protein